MNTEIINAESKDLSSYVKDRWKYKLKKGIITVAATMIIALSAFQQVSAQSNPDTKSVSQKIAEAITSQEFTSKSVEDQIILTTKWVEALSDKIQEQFSDHLKNKEFVKAEQDTAFYGVIAKRTGDKNIQALVERLKSDLEKEKKAFEQMNKDIHNQVRHNGLAGGSIQYIFGSKYATFTESSKDPNLAEGKANNGLNSYINKNNLKTEQVQSGRKIDQQGKIFVVTVYVLLNQ
jgi:hypothetical protein